LNAGLVVIVATVVAFFLLPRILGARRVSSDIVRQKLAAGAKVIDVRSPQEYRSGAYPGAVNIPLQILHSRLGELPKDRAIVLYCASGARSAAAAAMLKRAGFVDVVNAGGIADLPH